MRKIKKTESLCPVCFRKVTAYIIARNGKVFLEKNCPEHGNYEVLVWNDDLDSYIEWEKFGGEGEAPIKSLTDFGKGCPFDCGLCPQHKARTCFAIVEVTNRCNLNCPICFADSNGSSADPSIESIKKKYENVLTYTDAPPPLQLSGGEPTVREDLPELVTIANEMGFEHIQINTNGIRIAEDLDYLKKLKDAGTADIFLQFDGLTNRAYNFIRGKELLQVKIQALKNCAEVKIGVVLVPVLIPGINDDQVGPIIKFAKKWIPTVKGIHFQPVSYFGRYPIGPEKNRMTLPDLLSGIEIQTGGELKKENFIPRARRSSFCAFGGFFVLDENDRLIPLTNLKTISAGGSIRGRGVYKQVRKFVSKRWRSAEENDQCKGRPDSWDNFYERAKIYYLSISAMPFQDVFNVDLERVQNCCTHVVTQNGIIPLCIYYMTNIDGKKLNGREDD